MGHHKGTFRIQSNILDGAFCENSLLFTNFARSFILVFDFWTYLFLSSECISVKGGSRTAATSKMERFYYHKGLHLGCCSSPRSASVCISLLNNVSFMSDVYGYFCLCRICSSFNNNFCSEFSLVGVAQVISNIGPNALKIKK